MRRPLSGLLLVALAAGSGGAGAAAAQVTSDVPAGRADAVVDLTTSEGVRLVQGAWRFMPARVIEVDHRAPGPDLRPSGPPTRTNDIAPRAGGLDVDEAGWEQVAPGDLLGRRTTGRLAFGWYRTAVTIPARVGTLDPTGSTVVFEIVVDDYAEIWVDGRLTPVLGQTGGQLIKGWNAPNRVVLTRNARPGQRIQIAVFAANGPLSDPPVNFVWVRSATLDFYKHARPGMPAPMPVAVDRKDPALDAVVPRGAAIRKLAGGFTFIEGPVWVRDGGYLLFSDPNENNIYRWTPEGEVSVWRTKSGYAGVDIAEYRQPGSNGLALDRDGRVTVNQHGNRRVLRIERNGSLTVMADRYQGRRLNSPNDLVYKSDGSLYFTDPPFGLPKAFQDARKELPYSGVFRVKEGVVELLSADLTGPNGLAFSPDERYLYVDNWDPSHKVIMRYEVTADGRLRNGRVFFDITTSVPGDEGWDGIKVDARGNVYAAGPEGIYVLDPGGRHLGTIRVPEHVANFAFGGEDGRSLFITASTGLYRMELLVPGAGLGEHAAAARR